jgi:hypothetical protein
MPFYEDSFTFLYVDDIRTSQETLLTALNDLLRGQPYSFFTAGLEMLSDDGTIQNFSRYRDSFA